MKWSLSTRLVSSGAAFFKAVIFALLSCVDAGGRCRFGVEVPAVPRPDLLRATGTESKNLCGLDMRSGVEMIGLSAPAATSFKPKLAAVISVNCFLLPFLFAGCRAIGAFRPAEAS